MTVFSTPAPITATVDIVLGDIRFTAADRSDTVVEVAPIDPTRGLDIEAAQQVNVEFEGGRLRVWQPRLRGAFARKYGSVTIAVHLPAGSDVQGDTADGEYVVQGAVGACRLKNAIGDIKVAEAASVRLKTTGGRIVVDRVRGRAEVGGSGDVRVGRVDGDAVVKNIGGDTRIGAVGGDLWVQSANGPIGIESVHGSVHAKTAIGEIRVGAIGEGPVELHTAVGRLEVGVPEGTAVHLDARTPTGRVRNHVEHTEQPDRKVEVKARTSGGDIVVRRTGTGA